MPEKSHIILEEEHLAQLSKRETSSEIDDDEPKDIGELLGFRITGGRDFYMPITIFHVSKIFQIHNLISQILLNVFAIGERKQSSRKSKFEAG